MTGGMLIEHRRRQKAKRLKAEALAAAKNVTKEPEAVENEKGQKKKGK